MNIFPSFILLIHVTFSNYLLSVFVYYIVKLYTLPMPSLGFGRGSRVEGRNSRVEGNMSRVLKKLKKLKKNYK